MPAQYLNVWNPSVIVAAHTALLTALGSSASVSFHDSGDVELARVPLDATPGVVNGTTGALTIAPTQRDEEAAAGGTASYASLRNSSNVVLQSLPCQQGTTPVSGKCVVSSLTVVQGAPFELVSWEVQ